MLHRCLQATGKSVEQREQASGGGSTCLYPNTRTCTNSTSFDKNPNKERTVACFSNT